MSISRIASRSPYYLPIALVSPLTGATCTEFTIKIYTWTGLVTAIPATPTFEITRANFEASTGTDNVEVGRVINGELNVGLSNPALSPSGAITDQYSGNQIWVKTEIYYTTPNPADDGIAQVVSIYSAYNGWINGFEDKNTNIPENISMTNRIIRIKRDRSFTVPTMNVVNLPMGAPSPFTIISYPTTSINVSSIVPASNKSDELIRFITIDPSDASPQDKKIVLLFNTTHKVTFVFDNDNRYDQIDIYFINKFGAQETIPMRRQKSESINVTQESYSGSFQLPIDGFHQVNQFNVNGKVGLRLNSGYMPETANETFKELMLSDKVWLFDGTDTKPVTIKSTSLSIQTVKNEKLINYEIQFEHAFFEINNI